MFITFEGGEGSGKTTIINRVFQHLSSKNHTVIKTREPGGSKEGEQIRKILLAKENTITPMTELLLYLSSREDHYQKVIKPALDNNKIVICDRYIDSTLAYQGYARGISLGLIRKLHELTLQTPYPDLTLLLDVPPEIGIKRVEDNRADKNRLDAEDMAFHTKVRNGFLLLSKQEPQRVKVIDASQDIETVVSQTINQIELFIKERQNERTSMGN